MSSHVSLIWITPEAEQLIGYIARVSSPPEAQEEKKNDYEKLIKYLIVHEHWSPFEMANMCVEIHTTRAISAQIYRHWSFNFHIQEFSQRYAEVEGFEKNGARRQDLKNRQSSIDDVKEEDKKWFNDAQNEVWNTSSVLYKEALSRGIAKECARALLPMNTTTRLYMNGNIRSWIFYLKLRCDKGAQLEHQIIANEVKRIFYEKFPIIAKVCEEVVWK